MPIAVQCSTCQSKFQVPDHYCGRQVKCPQCLGLIEVPGQRPPAGPASRRTRPASKPHHRIDVDLDSGRGPDVRESAAPPSDGMPGTGLSTAVPEIDSELPPVPQATGSLLFPPQSPPLLSAEIASSNTPSGGGVSENTEVGFQVSPAPATDALSAWYLRTEDAEYGPVPRDELDRWKTEGRIDASCQLLAEGWDQWQWADSVYPELAETPLSPPTILKTEGFPEVDLGNGNRLASVSPSECEAPPVIETAGGEVDRPREESRHEEPTTSAPRADLSPAALRTLAETRPWVALLAIAGVILGGLGVLGSTAAGVSLLFSAGVLAGVCGLMTVVGPALLVLVSVSLVRYAWRIREVVQEKPGGSLEAMLAAQRSFWKLAGWLTLAAIGLYLLVGGASLAMAMMSR